MRTAEANLGIGLGWPREADRAHTSQRSKAFAGLRFCPGQERAGARPARACVIPRRGAAAYGDASQALLGARMQERALLICSLMFEKGQRNGRPAQARWHHLQPNYVPWRHGGGFLDMALNTALLPENGSLIGNLTPRESPPRSSPCMIQIGQLRPFRSELSSVWRFALYF